MTSLITQETIDQEDNLERTLDEIEALRSILGEKSVQCVAISDNILSIQLISTSPEPEQTFKATLTLQLSRSYPSHSPPQFMSIDCQNVPGFNGSSCAAIFQNIWADAEGEVCLYDMISWLNERLTDIEEDEKYMKLQHQNDSALATALATADSIQHINNYTPTHFGRRCIYTHHTIANSKRTAVIRTALQLGLSGISKIGWPGVIVIEGDENACQEYVRYVSSLRWKQLTVRGEEVYEMKEEDTIDSLRAFPPGFQEFGEKCMSDAAKTCRDVGLEDLFLTAMKIYKKV